MPRWKEFETLPCAVLIHTCHYQTVHFFFERALEIFQIIYHMQMPMNIEKDLFSRLPQKDIPISRSRIYFDNSFHIENIIFNLNLSV